MRNQCFKCGNVSAITLVHPGLQFHYALNLGSPETELAPALLEQIETILSADAAYAARIQEHYRLFRRRIEVGRTPAWFETGTANAGPGRRRPWTRKVRRR